MTPVTPLDTADQPLLNDVRALISSARTRTSQAVNAEMTLLYWQVGNHVREHVLNGKRAAYGEQIIAGLARALRTEFGRGWSVPQLRHCVRIAETFHDEAIVSALRRQLSWTHLKTLMYLDDPLKRDFYTELCRLEGWSARRLSERINSMLYERTAIAKQPDQAIREDLDRLRDEGAVSDALTFRDPYVLDFLGLADTYSEQDLESAILAELQLTLIELGNDFAFVARQKRITIDNRDYYIDLLFFHRRLRALIAVDLLCVRAHNE